MSGVAISRLRRCSTWGWSTPGPVSWRPRRHCSSRPGSPTSPATGPDRVRVAGGLPRGGGAGSGWVTRLRPPPLAPALGGATGPGTSPRGSTTSRHWRPLWSSDPTDATAEALLGHWCYAHGRVDEAIAPLAHIGRLDGSDPVVWRNLGLAGYNHEHDAEAATTAYERALSVAPGDARLLFESDQLLKRIGAPVELRLVGWSRSRPR